MIKLSGGKPYVAPTIEIKPLWNKKIVKQIIKGLINKQIDYFIFMSVNAVSNFMLSLELLKLKPNFFNKLNNSWKIAIGPKTRKELIKNGIEPDLIPKNYSSEGLIDILKKLNLKGKFIVIPRSKNTANVLNEKLKDLGATVIDIPVYENTLPKDHSKVFTLVKDLIERKIDIITFTSPSTVLNLFQVAEKHKMENYLRESLNKIVIAAIGPITKQTLEKLGVRVEVVPREYTTEAMLSSLIKFLD